MATTTARDPDTSEIPPGTGSGHDISESAGSVGAIAGENLNLSRRRSLVEYALSGDSAIILRKLLHLRLVVLSTLVCSLWVLDTQSSWPVNYPMILASIGFGFSWSMWVLLQKSNHPVPPPVLRELLIDGVLLALVVYSSGRSENPFIYYFLVLIAIASSVLRARVAWLFSGAAVTVYTLFLYLDIKNHFDHMPADYQFHLLGMWINFCGSATVTCFFISRLAETLRRHQQQLIQAREETLQHEHLIGIGTLAASTVHALGTPLSTLTVMLGEMQNTTDSLETKQDIDLMLSQLSRCKDTMKKLSLLAEQERAQPTLEPVCELVADLDEHYAVVRPSHNLRINCESPCTTRLLVHSFVLRHALINLIDNAIDAARKQVTVEFRAQGAALSIAIVDDGCGMPDRVVARWGKPQSSDKETGLGIGVLLANSTIERLGGTVAIEARARDTAAANSDIETCTRIFVTLPLADVPTE